MSNRSGQDIGRTILGVILLIAGLSALGLNGSVIGWLFFIGGLAFLGALLSGRINAEEITSFLGITQSPEEAQARAEAREAARAEARQRAQLARERVRDRIAQNQEVAQTPPARPRLHRTAVRAMQRAGHDPVESPVRLADVGLLVYDGSDAPYVEREDRLPVEADYVRPFMVLRSPQAAQGKIRFELIDGDGVRRFIDETPWRFQAGETFVYPQTWLPLRNLEAFGGNWTLRVYAAGTLIGAHEFRWRDPGGGEFREYIDGDGEFTDQLYDEFKKVRLHRLSLEDLLAEQEGGVVERDPEVEAAARRHDQLNQQHNRRR
ncbi:MAG: hypothetical protein JW910_18065 [Anaerolineae bacterium]|nr:hypothetical protein [Anaerolineae bacterium]